MFSRTTPDRGPALAALRTCAKFRFVWRRLCDVVLLRFLFLFGFLVPYRTLNLILTPTTATTIGMHERIKVTLINI